MAVLRIETDAGIVGWGEPVVEGRAEVVRAAVDVFSEYLIGQGRCASKITGRFGPGRASTATARCSAVPSRESTRRLGHRRQGV